MRDNLIGRPERAQFIGAPIQFQVVGKFYRGRKHAKHPEDGCPTLYIRPGVNASSVVFFEPCGLLENLS